MKKTLTVVALMSCAAMAWAHEGHSHAMPKHHMDHHAKKHHMDMKHKGHHYNAKKVAKLMVNNQVQTSDCWIRLLPAKGVPSVAFLKFTNPTDKAVRLTGVYSPDFKMAQMHETKIENGNATMMHLAQVKVAPHGSIEFKPKSYHIMLMGNKGHLKEGGTAKLSLIINQNQKHEVQCTVKGPASM